MMVPMVVSTLTLVTPIKTIDPRALVLGETIASGKHGTVQWAEVDGLKVVAKHASTEFSEEAEIEHDRQLAAMYLDTEAEINRLLDERAPDHSSLELHEQTIAPFLGTAIKDGTRYLVWEAAGEETLEQYLRHKRLGELAKALGCEEAQLPRRALQDVLRCLAHLHACGISHRDLKPSNLLVDASTQTLRLIDFGSAADCADWLSTRRRGWRAVANRMPCCALFSAAGVGLAPKRPLAERSGWYKFDVYAAALTWLCVVVPALAKDYDMLAELRISLRAHEHDPQEWREACTDGLSDEGPGCTVPDGDGFEEVFGWRSASGTVDSGWVTSRSRVRQLWERVSRSVWRVTRSIQRVKQRREEGSEQEHAWQLLTGLMARDPERRPSAAEALLGSYLNSDCTEGELPLAAPEPWTLEGLLSATGMAPARRLVSGKRPL